MVVMLIMSIILAAMAPVMTTRSKADSSSPWRYSPENLSDAFFGAGESQVAMIGQPNKLETDDPARLIINSSASLPVHLSFKRGDTILGRLQFSDTNVLLGSGNFDHINGGSNNISIGPNNLTQLTSGSSNIAIGDSALSFNTTGSNNTALGTSLIANTTGSFNTALGDDSLRGNTTHSNNTSVGYNALMSADNDWNTAVGSKAYQNGTGGSNTIIGGDSMSQGSGNNNVTLGTNSLRYGTGDGNVAIGANSNYRDKTLTTFTNSTAIGFSSFASGTNSVAIGSSASSSGENSIAIGNLSNSSDSNNVSIGNGSIASGNWSTATGFESSASGDYSSAYGEQSTSSGGSSIALGNGATSAGISSVALGNEANAVNTDSIAIGHFATTRDQDAIAIGHGVTASGESSIAIGSNAIYHTTQHTTQALADKAIAIGDGAFATGEDSIALGTLAEARASNNIAIGTQACEGVTGSNKICIGANSGPNSLSESMKHDSIERVFIGSRSRYNNGSAVLEVHNTSQSANFRHYQALPNNATSVVINGNLLLRGRLIMQPEVYHKDYAYRMCTITMTSGDDNDYAYYRYCDGQSSSLVDILSDRNLKYVGKENTSGLDKIRQLKVFNYTFKKDEKKTPHVGVIAQDLQKVFPDAVKKGSDGFLRIRMEDMFFAVINAIKELDSRVTVLEKENKELKNQIKEQNSRLKALETKLNKIYTEN